MSSSHNPRPKRSSAALPLQNAQKQSWKAKFSDKQLERKRQLDRINQRRTRQQSKQSTALLKDKVDLLMQGDHKTLLERMMAENEAMRAKLNVFQAKFEHVHQISRESSRPCVRDRLTKTWHEHDTETLIRTLLRGFSVRTTGITREEPLIYAKDNTGLELSTHFDNAIADIHNFYEQPDFLAQNPDLSAYARADSRTALAISSTGVDHSSSFSIPRLSFDSDFIHGKGQPNMPPGHPMSMIPFQTDWRGKEKAQGSFSYPEAPEFGTMGAYVPADMHEPHCSMSLPFPDASLTQSANGNPLSWSSADYGTADYGTGQLLTLSPTKANYLDWEEKQLDVQPSDVFGIRGTLSYFNS
ncbi:hypothetical protein N7541_008537 [Penicillium brevicompactum]|uniref:BZIP domain-containing protein n=1 Tax=Penicillium brevicompactum TaxID=5074 RepID=A0A9W9QZC1_PENBR|nr:hypothetical protein N7541_008537 [Penicillium brevicompactum]